MAKQTQVQEPREWEDVAGIGPKRAKRIREELGDYSDWKGNSTTYKKNTLSRVHTGNRRNQPEFAQNALDASSSRTRNADVVDSDLVKEREVDQRSARTRSKTTIQGRNADADRSDLGFETMERDPEKLDRAAERFTDEYDDPFEPSPRDIGQAAMDRQEPEDRATVQPIIGAATSRTVFASREPGQQFRQELEQTAESTDRPTASPGELADAFVDFVEDDIGLGPRGSLRGPTTPTDIGREADGEFARPETAPDVTPAPVARNNQNGQFGLDPFDLTSGGIGESVDLLGGGQDSEGTQRDQFDKTVTVGVTPVTGTTPTSGGSGFRVETDDKQASKTLGKGSAVIEQADNEVGLPDPSEADSTDVVAEAEVGFKDRDSGFGYDTEVVETRETDDNIFSFR